MKLIIFLFIQYSFAQVCLPKPSSAKDTKPNIPSAKKPEYFDTKESLWDTKTFKELTAMHKDHSASIAPKQYDSSKAIWDGNVLSASELAKMDKIKVHNALCPTGNVLKGIDALYAKHPFIDPSKPTMEEVDKWNLKVFEHFRTMLGVKTELKMDKCLSAQALWALQYRSTDKFGDNSKLCTGKPHCGWTFVPSNKEQKNMFSDGSVCRKYGSKSEGVLSTSNDLNWAWKIPRMICSVIKLERFTGHSGPFVRRPYVGFAFGNKDTVNVQWWGKSKCPSVEGVDQTVVNAAYECT